MTNEGISASELRNLQYDIGGRVNRLADNVRETVTLQKELRNELQSLRKQFTSFIDEDRRARNMQFAQTSLVDVRAQLDRKFGHHETVRRNTIGMLQAMDVGIVTEATLRQAAEHLMIDAPGYWLAPVQVALAAWIQDDPAIADRALLAAASRDPNKTALFFSLVLARYERHKATAQWIKEYFRGQNRTALSRDFTVVLDAVTQGALGANCRGLVADHCIAWLEQLNRHDDMVQKQVSRWRQRMDRERSILGGEFSVLPVVCPDWSTTLRWLEGATVHAGSERWLRSRFDAAMTPDEGLRQRVDDILRNLITAYDEDEEPLRQEEAGWQAVIKRGGKHADAPTMQGDTQTHERRVNFLTLLTDIAIHPDKAEASVVTEQFAIGMAGEWIKQAAGELATASRSEHPGSLEVNIHGWGRKLRPDDKEEILVNEFSNFIDARIRHDVREVNARRSFVRFLVASTIMVVSVGLLLGFRTTSNLYSRILLGIVVLIFVISAASLLRTRSNMPIRKEDVRKTWEARKKDGAESIGGALREVKKLFGLWEAAIAKEASLIEFIQDAAARQLSILPWEDAPSAPMASGQFAGAGHAEGDAEMPGDDAETDRLALNLPNWELLPPTSRDSAGMSR